MVKQRCDVICFISSLFLSLVGHTSGGHPGEGNTPRDRTYPQKTQSNLNSPEIEIENIHS